VVELSEPTHHRLGIPLRYELGDVVETGAVEGGPRGEQEVEDPVPFPTSGAGPADRRVQSGARERHLAVETAEEERRDVTLRQTLLR